MQTLFSLTVFLGALVAISIAGEMSEDKIKVLNECKEKEKASDADVQGFVSHMLPESQTAKCLTACVFETLGGMKDGKIDIATVKSNMAKMQGGEKGPFNEVADECQSITNSDRCELAAQFAECMHKGFAARHGSKKN